MPTIVGYRVRGLLEISSTVRAFPDLTLPTCSRCGLASPTSFRYILLSNREFVLSVAVLLQVLENLTSMKDHLELHGAARSGQSRTASVVQYGSIIVIRAMSCL